MPWAELDQSRLLPGIFRGAARGTHTLTKLNLAVERRGGGGGGELTCLRRDVRLPLVYLPPGVHAWRSCCIASLRPTYCNRRTRSNSVS